MSFGISFTIQSDQITPEEIDQITSILTGFKTGEAPKKLVTKKPSTKKAEEPKVEEPKVEEPKVEEPKVEEPKVEEPKVEEPKVEEPKVEEPKVEEPKVEEPKVEEPKVEEPKVEDDAVSPEMLKDLRAHAVALISASKDSELKGVLAKYGVGAISKLPKAGAEELLAVPTE